ncbi:hypothetical protein E2I00_010507 [Balaenoptera physalus]|uniref:G-protein coupled receptors family 1 profile domain-containing protein n=1 Tax=Balaenoptera physalus TaxID=9770 RepID=A0A643BUA7_BALPH|nr:hypothetical protein E2I00_010507 [Balaenoptera physalus]
MNSYFYLLLLIYLFIITGTLMVFFFIKLDSHLHTPMYFFISVLSFLEIWYTITIIHKILSNQVSEQKTISLTKCLLHMHLFYSLVISELYKLTTMATDRYLAICNPFYYPTIITSQSYTQLTVLEIVHAVEIIMVILLVVLGYVCIIAVILHYLLCWLKPKAFSTCASHLAIFLIFFWKCSLYIPWPLAHSLQYYGHPLTQLSSLRSKEIKEAIKVHTCQSTIK